MKKVIHLVLLCWSMIWLSQSALGKEEEYMELPQGQLIEELNPKSFWGLHLQISPQGDENGVNSEILTFEYHDPENQISEFEIGTSVIRLKFSEMNILDNFKAISQIEIHDKFLFWQPFSLAVDSPTHSWGGLTVGARAVLGPALVGDMNLNTKMGPDQTQYESFFVAPITGVFKVEYQGDVLNVRNETDVYFVVNKEFSTQQTLSEPAVKNHLELSTEMTPNAICFVDSQYFRIPNSHETQGISHTSAHYIGGGCRVRY